MSSTRQQKVSRMLQKEMGEILSGKNSMLFRGKLVTVTEVRITPDLGLARIFLSVFPGPGPEVFKQTIEAQNAQIRHELGNRIRHQLRVVPELQFFLDESLDQLENIDRLLNQ